MTQARKRRIFGSRPVRGRWWRWLWRLPLLFVVLTVLQVGILRFVNPPFSAFMAARQFDAWLAGDWDYRIAHDWRALDRISPSLALAVVAAEDQNFPHHNGFDFEAINKAQKHNERMVVRAEKRGTPVRGIRGASTISQQTAKNLFLWQGSGVTRWLRKGMEVWYTGLIEALWPKQRILEMYVNFAEFGDGVYGAQAAARTYFGRDAANLSPAQCARLAAVLPSPRRYDARHPGPYVQRRSGNIERQMRHLGGPGYLDGLD